MRGGIPITGSAIQGAISHFTRKIREIFLGKPHVIKYSYDALYRLISVNQDGSLVSRYTFDPMGNRLTRRTSSDTTEYGHDACDEMSYAGDTSYRYDLKGRLIAEYDSTDNTERTYDWSYDDRLLYINYPDSTKSSMKYDFMGLRTYHKDRTGVITNYYWSLLGLPQVINETDGSGNPKASYILGTGLIAIKVSGVKKYYITDAMGSVLALTDNSGNVTDTYEYNEYGELTASTGVSYNPYRFTGQQWDENSGFYYMKARWLNSQTGRFTQRDPINSLAYTYAGNNPMTFIDPLGLDTIYVGGYQGNPTIQMYPGNVYVSQSSPTGSSAAYAISNYDVVIFVGHGTVPQKPAVFGNQQVAFTPQDILNGLTGSHHPQVVMLLGCYTGNSQHQNAWQTAFPAGTFLITNSGEAYLPNASSLINTFLSNYYNGGSTAVTSPQQAANGLPNLNGAPPFPFNLLPWLTVTNSVVNTFMIP